MLKACRRALTLLGVAAILLVPQRASAQEASISGTVVDQTAGVLPGVTITATHVTTGNTFVGVTDERGAFRLPLRTGNFRITVELAGFTTIDRTVELLLGQTAVVNLTLAPSTIQESVTVTGEAPLIDTTNSSLGSNIDPRQMQDLPVNGRNWVDLTLLAAGSRQNAVNEIPVTATGTTVRFELNLDGQQGRTRWRRRLVNRGTAAMRSRSSSSSRIGSMRARGTRAACR